MSAALIHDKPQAPAALLLASIIASSAAFGAAVGSYVGGFQILFAAVKMPAFFLGTLALCMSGLTAVASTRLSPAQCASAALRTVAMTTLVLGALSPVILLMGVSIPKGGPRPYLGMVLLLTVAVALAGAVSVVRLRRQIESRSLVAAWVALYAFVGAQLAWLLKPWIGYTLKADRFLPLTENLRGNFYEAVWNAALAFMR